MEIKTYKKLLVVFVLLFAMISSGYSYSVFDLGCWFNDKPQLAVNVLIYNEDGSINSTIQQSPTIDINQLTITEGQSIKFDFSPTTDDENNIRQERIFWLHNTRNDLGMNIQDNNNPQTNIGTDSFSSDKFDFYQYLKTGITKPQFFQENSKLMIINGNPQNDYVKTFKPNVGNYEVLFRVTDDCADSDGTDEVYHFFNLSVKQKPNKLNVTYTNLNLQDNFNRQNSNSLGIASNGNNWVNSDGGKTTYRIDNQNLVYVPDGSGNQHNFLTFDDTNYNYLTFDVLVESTPVGGNIWLEMLGSNISGTSAGPNGIYGNNIRAGGTSYPLTSNQWYKVEYRNIDTTTGSVDFYLDGVYKKTFVDNNINNKGYLQKIYFSGYSGTNTGQIKYRIDNLYTHHFNKSIVICDSNKNNIDLSQNPSNPIDISIKDGCSVINVTTHKTYNIYDERTNNNVQVNFIGNTGNGGNNGVDNFYFKNNVDNTYNFQIDGYFNGYFNKESNNVKLSSYADWNELHNFRGTIYSIGNYYGIGIYGNNSKIIIPNSFNNIYFYNGVSNSIFSSNYISSIKSIGYDTPFNNNVINIPNNIGYFETHTNNINGKISFNYFNISKLSVDNGIGNGNNLNTIYGNVFQFQNSSVKIDTTSNLQWSGNIGKNINGKILGNSWIDENGNDIFTCSGNINNISYNGITYKVCDIPQVVFSLNGNNISDYVIITDKNKGGFIPVNPIDPTIKPKIEKNQNPVAVLTLDKPKQVEVGTTVCWDSSSSYDTDGSIVSKTIWEDDKVYTNKDSNCIVRNSPAIVKVKLKVEDNDGGINYDSLFIKWSGNQATCSGNHPTDLAITNSNLHDNFYMLNMTTTDLDNDTNLIYAWTVNGETIYGKNIITPIDYNQNVYGSVFDGCNISSDYMNISVGKNFTEPTKNIDVNLVCSQDSLFIPSNVNCEAVYDLKGDTLKNVTWMYDNSIQSQNDGASIFSKNVDNDLDHTISVSILTNNGQIKTDYYLFNLVTNPIVNNGGGGSGSTTPTKKDCNIDITPSIVNLNDSNLMMKILIKNNEKGSWTPDYVFQNIDNQNSVKDKLSITNIIGTIQATNSKEIGIKYNKDLFSTTSINAENNIVFTSSNCNDIKVQINTNITNLNTIQDITNMDLLSKYSPSNLLNMTAIKIENIPKNTKILDKLKLWHIVLIVFLLFTIVFWNGKYSKSFIGNIISKILIITLTTTIVSTLLIYGLNWLITII